MGATPGDCESSLKNFICKMSLCPKVNNILLSFGGRAPLTRKLHESPPPDPLFTKIRIEIEFPPIFFLFRVVQEKIRISNRPLVYLLGEFIQIL